MLVWTGEAASGAPPELVQAPAPLAYTPPYLAEKILTSKSTLEGERKQVTVLFADLKGSMELLADRDPEDARRLLDPVLERKVRSGPMRRKSAVHTASRSRFGWVSTPGRWWSGRLAMTSTWITRQ